MLKDKHLLEVISQYLEDNKFDDDICKYILSAFESLENHYASHAKNEPEPTNYETVVKQYIDTIKKLDKLNLVRDINEDSYLCENIKPIDYEMAVIGYDKDEQGHYYITTDHPKFKCATNGYKNLKPLRATILFDEVTRKRPLKLMSTFFHEITHCRQVGFTMPWYVINYRHFSKCLREGHAMREARHAGPLISGYYASPLSSHGTTFHLAEDSGNPSILRYLYFKLEILLGHQFMDEWATAEDDDTYILKAFDVIDSKYGDLTFKKLYIYIQLVLLYLHKDELSNAEMELQNQKTLLHLYTGRNNPSLEELNNEYQELAPILNDQELLKQEYELYQKCSAEAKRYCGIGTANDKVCTMEEYYQMQKSSLMNLREQINIIPNLKNVRMLLSANKEIYKAIIDNSINLPSVVSKLDSLVVNCLEKELHLCDNDNFRKKVDYYNKNVYSSVEEAFNSEADLFLSMFFSKAHASENDINSKPRTFKKK